MRWQIANETRKAELAITNLISNKREWNNCFIKFGTVAYLENIVKFFGGFNFTKRPEVVAKTTAGGKSHGMRAICKLSSMKI